MLENLANCFKNYSNFTGRATRSEFWQFMLLFGICTFLARYIDGLDGVIVPVAGGMGIFELSVFLLLLLPTVTVGARRLHDSGRSGWWLLIFYIPYLGFVFTVEREQLQVAAAGALIVGATALIVQFCLPGDVQENRFGAPVKETGQTG